MTKCLTWNRPDFPRETLERYKLNRGSVEVYEIYINPEDMDVVASMPDDKTGCVDPRTGEPRKCPVAAWTRQKDQGIHPMVVLRSRPFSV